MKETGIQVRIWSDYGDLQTKIIFIEYRDMSIRVFNFFTQEVKDVPIGNEIPPEFILKIPSHLSSIFLQSLAESLDKQGIKTDKDAKISGILEATKYHLKDMRNLVFQQNKSK